MGEIGKIEKHEEQFCVDTTVEKQRAIKEDKEMIEMLQADTEKYEADFREQMQFAACNSSVTTLWTRNNAQSRRPMK